MVFNICNIQKFFPIMLWPMKAFSLLPYRSLPSPLERFDTSPGQWTVEGRDIWNARSPMQSDPTSSRCCLPPRAWDLVILDPFEAACWRFITCHQDGSLKSSSERSWFASLNSWNARTLIETEENIHCEDPLTNLCSTVPASSASPRNSTYSFRWGGPATKD